MQITKNQNNEIISINTDGEINWIEGVLPFASIYNAKYNSLKSSNEKNVYEYNGLEIIVKQFFEEEIGNYKINIRIFNPKDVEIKISKGEIGVFTPFNDSYTDSETCLSNRCHTHIWCGGSACYMYGIRMSGEGSVFGYALTKGSASNYGVIRKDNSNDRGDFYIIPDVEKINAKSDYELELELMTATSPASFIYNLTKSDSFLYVYSEKYTYAIGEKVNIYVKNPFSLLLQCEYPLRREYETSRFIATFTAEKIGENRVEIGYGDKKTFIIFNVTLGAESDILKRIDFIIDKQQCNNEKSFFNGAYLLYDNKREKQFVSKKPFCDHTAGRERIGMTIGINTLLLSGRYDFNKIDKYAESLARSIRFCDRYLIGKKGRIYDNAPKLGLPFHERLYNAPWFVLALTLYAKLTQKSYYIERAFKIITNYYKKGGAGFYAINIPVNLFLETAKELKLTVIYSKAEKMFLQHGDNIVKVGLKFPAHEVKFEQSIIAPSVDMLLECYIHSKDKKYLNEASKQIVLLNAFNGTQPDYHLNEVAIRHWDGYWFGESKLYGDTFPHYWSCISAMVFSKYSAIIDDFNYQYRADKCLDNNLKLIQNGVGSCAYIYPYQINGKNGQFADEWANDQDWIIYYQMMFHSRYKLYFEIFKDKLNAVMAKNADIEE